MINLTPSAHLAVSRLCREDQAKRSFRIFIQHKGCDGLTFGFGMDEPLPVDSCQIDDDDALILITTRVAQLLRGSTLSYDGDAENRTVELGLFSLKVPDPDRFRGKFYRDSAANPMDWDRLG